MKDPSTAEGICSLCDPRVETVLDRLHGEARGQTRGMARLGWAELRNKIARRKLSVVEEGRQKRDVYIPVSAKQGAFLYLVARSIAARRIVEFGTSAGISTIYLAAAVRDNGGGIVIGSEIEPGKIAKARAHIEEAGLSDQVEVREGDARETLRDPGGSVDMVLLDGMKDLYVPIIEMLAPHLRRGAVVLADNIFTFRKSLAPYRAHMRDIANGFQSVTLLLGDGTEYSVRI
jgi:predicted O-methyltransferase YrrM